MLPRLFTYLQLTAEVQARVIAKLQEGAGDDPALVEHLREVLARELRDFNYPDENFERLTFEGEDVIWFYGDLDLRALANRLLDMDTCAAMSPHLEGMTARLVKEQHPTKDEDSWGVVFNYVLKSKPQDTDALFDAIVTDSVSVATHLAGVADEELRYVTEPVKLREFLESDSLARYLEDGTIAVEAQEDHFDG